MNGAIVVEDKGFLVKHALMVVVGAIVTAFVTFQVWLAGRAIKYGERLSAIEEDRITRKDFDELKTERDRKFEEQRKEMQEKFDELRESMMQTHIEGVRTIKEDLGEISQKQEDFLLLLARQGLSALRDSPMRDSPFLDPAKPRSDG